MKRLVLLVVVALGMSATSFAGEKVEGKDWKVDVNVAKLSKYLNLDARQMEDCLLYTSPSPRDTR